MISACSTIKVPDPEWCTELPSHGAFCTYTFSNDERLVTPEDWAKESVGRFSVSAKDLAKNQNFVNEVCQKHKCTVEEKKALKRLFGIVNEATKMAN